MPTTTSPTATQQGPAAGTQGTTRAPASQPRGNGFAAQQVAGQSPSSSSSSRLPRLSNPAPAVEGEVSQEVLGVRIVGRGVSPTAVEACARFVTATIAGRPDIQDRLKDEEVVLVIIPRNRKMTDMPEFANLRGDTTVDGRLWDNVRGSGGKRVRGGAWAIAVPEENLVEVGTDTYGEGYNVGLHEFAHTIHSQGLPRSERERIEALYEARKRANGPWT
ncbi:MAG: hypothetical protein ACK4YP_00695, partial [Myxococcota bacterium]